jgi:hypothetical protein
MEILIVVAIMTIVVKRGAEDLIHTARGGTPPRLAAAKARRKSGAAGRYWGALWDDVWTDAAAKRADRRAGRTSGPASSRPRGAATQFFAGLLQDGKRAAGRSWENGWTRLDERRREKATRARPGQQTVQGKVVPNAEGEPAGEDRLRDKLYRRVGWSCIVCGSTRDIREVCFGDKWPHISLGLKYCPQHLKEAFPKHGPQDGTGPQDEDRPQDGDGTVPTSVPDEDGTGPEFWTDLQDEYPEQDQDEDEQDDPDSGPDSGPDQDITPPATPTTEGPTTMSNVTGEVTGLSDTIKFCEGSSEAFRAQIHATELTVAAAAAGGVTGPGAAKLAHAMELCTAAAAAYDEAAAEFKAHTAVQEAYDANPGAGTREFVTAGR